MEEEMRALDANDTWDLVDPPRHCKPIGCKWVYKVKYNADGSVNRMVRVVLAVAAARGWHLHQMNVTNTFL